MNRIDLRHLVTYVIDPPMCTDADDAFAFEDLCTLWIFVADPTDSFSYNSDLCRKVLEQCITTYYIDKPPDHLFPYDIVQKHSLHVGVKNAIGVRIKFEPQSYCILEKSIHLVTIEAKKVMNYEDAELDNVLINGIKISRILFERRKSIGKILSDWELAYPRWNDNVNKWELRLDTSKTRMLKKMIAEFAILANQVAAGEIHAHNPHIQLFRSCDGIQSDDNKPISPESLINEIVSKGIGAQYELDDNKHLLIDDKIYTHFTSPLRRACDCMVHFLLKAKLNNTILPFTQEELQKHVIQFNTVQKKDKKRQFNENKHFTILAMKSMPKPINVGLKINNITGYFVNMIMTKIEDFPVQMSITLKDTLKQGTLRMRECDVVNIPLTVIVKHNPTLPKFDSEIFPELNITKINEFACVL